MSTTDKRTPNFNFDKALKADAKNEPFMFTLDGKVHEIKHINDLDAIDLSGIGQTADVNWRILKHAATEDTYKAIRAARPTVGQLNGLMTAYNEHCGIESGE